MLGLRTVHRIESDSQWQKQQSQQRLPKPLQRQYPYPLQLSDTVILSWVEPTAQPLLVEVADEWDALRESAQLGLLCFPSINPLFSHSERLPGEKLFQALPARAGFEQYNHRDVELGKLRTVETTLACN